MPVVPRVGIAWRRSLSGYAYPRGVRLCRPAEFTRVYRGGRRITAGCLQICYAPAADGQARLGLAIAKRVLPRAVDRNRAKRLVRDAFRHQHTDLPALDIVVSVRGRKQRGVPDHIIQDLNRLWLRLVTG